MTGGKGGLEGGGEGAGSPTLTHINIPQECLYMYKHEFSPPSPPPSSFSPPPPPHPTSVYSISLSLSLFNLISVLEHSTTSPTRAYSVCNDGSSRRSLLY